MNPIFLVFVNFSLVAKDVAATLKQMGLGEPLVVESEDDAVAKLSALKPDTAVKLAVVQASPAEFATSALREALERLGAQVVLLHDSVTADFPSPPYPMLSVPFFTDDLEQIVMKFLPSLGSD
ncbi:MAG: hypothetical protein IIX61_05235 [Loktanella sp.]|nr:hypothetical protein [Loktanella sp.]